MEPRRVVERYYAVVSDLDSTPEALAALLHPDLRVVEHPNALNPNGTVRDRDGVLAAFAAGKQLLSEQVFDVRELLADGDRVAVRAEWRGRLAVDAGPLAADSELTAHIASFVTVDDDLVREHETFDCYEPLPGD
jgi:ketosteroid isomerase-like protein